MDWEAIYEALHAWATAQLGITCWWADQDYPRDAFPFATLKIIQDTGVGVDEVRYVNPGGTADLNQFVCGQRQFTLSVQVYTRSKWPTQNAKFYLSKLRDALHKPTALAMLVSADVKIISPEQSQDLSGLGDGAMESRAAMDIRMAAHARVADGAEGYFNKAEVTGTLAGTNNPPTYERTIPLGELP